MYSFPVNLNLLTNLLTVLHSYVSTGINLAAVKQALTLECKPGSKALNLLHGM